MLSLTPVRRRIGKRASPFRAVAFFAMLFLRVAVEATGGTTPALYALTPRTEDRSVRLWLTIFPADEFRLRVIDNSTAAGKARYFDLAEATKAEGGLAGINGGFFDRDPFAPVGLMMSDGQRTGTFNPKSWMRGLLVIRADGAPTLENIASFSPESTDLVGLLQSGPWLVRDGQAETDNRRSPVAKRTFIGHDGDGRWFFGLCDSCSLHELATLLRGPEVRAIIDVHAALNLDGGPSSALWATDGSRVFSRQESWSVRNFVIAVPKPDAPRETSPVGE